MTDQIREQMSALIDGELPRDQVDLRRPDQTEQWMAAAKPQADAA